MRTKKLIVFFTLVFCLNGFSQTNLSIQFRVEKQAMSTPMSNIDEAFFMNYYYAKPININFDGSSLKMSYDNRVVFINKQLTEISREEEMENNDLILETILFTDINNTADTISLVVDHQVGYVQFILPTKNSQGDYVGYTSFRQFIKESQLALK